jgi:hypothetical protein
MTAVRPELAAFELVGLPLYLVDDKPTRVDLFVGALGFEPRCTHAFEALQPVADTCLIIGFEDRHVEGFEHARRLYQHHGVEPVIAGNESVPDILRARLNELPASEEVTVAVDVSSFSRLRLALILEELADARLTRMNLELYYSPAAFSKPGSPDSSLEILQAVTPGLGGYESDPELPSVAVVGIGYEEQRGLGVIEFLEASDAWALVPRGFDQRFDDVVYERNKVLIERMSDRVLEYNPGDAVETFRLLQSLTHSLRKDYRIVMVPMGPKILAACCIMIGIISNGQDAVWRASSGELEVTKPVEAEGTLVGLRFRTPN